MKPNAPPPQPVMNPVFLTNGSYPEEVLSHFAHQLGDRLPLAAGSSPCPLPVSWLVSPCGHRSSSASNKRWPFRCAEQVLYLPGKHRRMFRDWSCMPSGSRSSGPCQLLKKLPSGI
jgi:hypothetical protein